MKGDMFEEYCGLCGIKGFFPTKQKRLNVMDRSNYQQDQTSSYFFDISAENKDSTG